MPEGHTPSAYLDGTEWKHLTRAHAHPCTHICVCGHPHARAHAHSAGRRSGLHGESATSAPPPPPVVPGEAFAQHTSATWPEPRRVPWCTVKRETRDVPVTASAAPPTGLRSSSPAEGAGPATCWACTGGAQVGQQEACWWPPGYRGQAPRLACVHGGRGSAGSSRRRNPF